MSADTIVTNAKITTLGGKRSASAVAIKDGRFAVVGEAKDVESQRGGNTQVIDANGRTVIPGLNDSHLHVIRGGLSYNMELRWDGVPTLADAMQMLRDQARHTPPPQWVRVTGGWGEFQFAERRMPTLDEINAAAPDTPVFVLHLYDRAILNGAALRAVGYTKDTPDPPGSEIQRDRNGNPTGVLIARPNAGLLYATLGKGPKLSHGDQVNSSRHFMREMNRFGLTSIVDAGGGSQAYPEDYQVIEELNRQDQLTLRIAYNLFTQKPKGEFDDFSRFVGMLKPGQGNDVYRVNGAGEMLVYSAADFEDFLEPRPDFAPSMENDLKRVVRLLAENKWPFRIHATFDESITRMLNVFEEVNREVPFQARWFFDHAETISDRNLERVKALKGGIAIQCRMAFQGEYCIDRYGKKATERTPPIRRMLEMGIPVGAGTDATRVATYNPFIALYWLVSGKTVGGTTMYPEANRMTREEALRLYTVGSSWFSSEEGKKGCIEPGQLADLAVLSADYFSVPEEQIRRLESVLTVMGGKVVYAAEEFSKLAPPLPPVSPDWSPVAKYGGYARSAASGAPAHHAARSRCSDLPRSGWAGFPEGIGCPCFAF